MEKETRDPKTWQWTTADKLFLQVVREAHNRGMHVIIDGVFNHTGRDFFAFKDIREKQEGSAYKDWYQVESFDDPKTARNEFSYKGWWGHKTLPIFAASPDKKDMAAGPKDYILKRRGAGCSRKATQKTVSTVGGSTWRTSVHQNSGRTGMAWSENSIRMPTPPLRFGKMPPKC